MSPEATLVENHEWPWGADPGISLTDVCSLVPGATESHSLYNVFPWVVYPEQAAFYRPFLSQDP